MGIERYIDRLDKVKSYNDPIIQSRLLNGLKNDLVERMQELARKKQTQPLTPEEEAEVTRARQFIIEYETIAKSHEENDKGIAKSIRKYSQELRVALEQHIDACQDVHNACRVERDEVDREIVTQSAAAIVAEQVAQSVTRTLEDATQSITHTDSLGSQITTTTRRIVTDIPRDMPEHGEAGSSVPDINDDEAVCTYLGLPHNFVDKINFPSFLAMNARHSLNPEVTYTYQEITKMGYTKRAFWNHEVPRINVLIQKLGDPDFVNRLKNLALRVDVTGIEDEQQRGVTELIAILGDQNNDGVITQGDNLFFDGRQVQEELMNMTPKQHVQFLANLNRLTGSQQNMGIQELIEYFRIAENKNRLYSLMYSYVNIGINPLSVLVGTQETVQNEVLERGRLLAVAQEEIDQRIDEIGQQYDAYVEGVRASTLNNLSPEKREEVLSVLQENKQGFLDGFKNNGASLFVSMIESQKGIAAGAHWSHIPTDQVIRQVTGGLVDSIGFTLGATNIGGGLTPGIGVNFKSLNIPLGNSGGISINTGLINFIPYLAASVQISLNQREIQEAGFQNFGTSDWKIGVYGNVSTLSHGFGLTLSKNQVEAMTQKTEQFDQALSGVMASIRNLPSPVLLDNITQALNANPELTRNEADRNHIPQFAEKIYQIFQTVQFDTLSVQHKAYILSGIQRTFTQEWRLQASQAIASRGWRWTAGGIGLQFIAGFLPLPTLGLSWQKSRIEWTPDQRFGTTQVPARERRTQTTHTTVLENRGLSQSLEQINADVDTYITRFEAAFTGTQNAEQSPIAQRNPTDFPKFLRAMKDGNMGNAFTSLKRILRTDPVLRGKYAKKDIRDATTQMLGILDTITQEEEMSYIIAQFMDIIFADKNSISEVLTGKATNGGRNDFWEQRGRGLKGVYPADVYDRVMQLREQLRGKISEISPQAVPSLISFVASYKIRYNAEGKAVSMGKHEAAIPPGLTSVVGGVNGLVDIPENDAVLKNHIVSNFKNTPYFKRLENMLGQILVSFKPELSGKMTENHIVELLMNGQTNVGGQEITMERKFVAFLYGRCANESLGIDIKGIRIAGTSTQITGEQMMRSLQVRDFHLEDENFHLGVIGGRREKSNPEPTEPPESTEPPEPTEPPPSTPPPQPTEPPQPSETPQPSKTPSPTPSSTPPQPKPTPTPTQSNDNGRTDPGGDKEKKPPTPRPTPSLTPAPTGSANPTLPPVTPPPGQNPGR